jgi:hypothetical protein
VVGSILRSRRRVSFKPKSEQNAMNESEDPNMTAVDQTQSIFDDHNHAGEVGQTRPHPSTEALVQWPQALLVSKYLSSGRFP